MGGRSRVGQPPSGCAGAKRVGVEAGRQIRALSRGVMAGPEAEVAEPCCREKPLSVEVLGARTANRHR